MEGRGGGGPNRPKCLVFISLAFGTLGAHLAAVGFQTPTWAGVPRLGWQRTATIPVHGQQIEGTVRRPLSLSEQAMFKSQGGPLSSVLCTCFPTFPVSRIDSSAFWVLLLRRLWLRLLRPPAPAGGRPLATTTRVAAEPRPQQTRRGPFATVPCAQVALDTSFTVARENGAALRLARHRKERRSGLRVGADGFRGPSHSFAN